MFFSSYTSFAWIVSSFMSLNPDVKLLCQSIFNFKSSSRYLTNWGIAAEMEITYGDLFINFGFCILLGDLSDSNLHRV